MLLHFELSTCVHQLCVSDKIATDDVVNATVPQDLKPFLAGTSKVPVQHLVKGCMKAWTGCPATLQAKSKYNTGRGLGLLALCAEHFFF